MACNGAAAASRAKKLQETGGVSPALDLSKLTDLQCSVWLKDQEGIRPIEIGEQLGLTPRRVCNIKARLRVLGFPINQLWTVAQLNGHLNGAATDRDDELPDDDEPVMRGPVQRCRGCGLTMPCHDCVSLEKYATVNPGWTIVPDGDQDEGETAPDAVVNGTPKPYKTGDIYGRRWHGRRKSDRTGQVLSYTEAASERGETEASRPGLHD